MTDSTVEPYADVGPQRPGLPGRDAGLAVAIVASAADAILALDPSGTILTWNRGCEVLFGWTAAEAVGRSATMLLPAARRAELNRILTSLHGPPEDAALETERLHRTGTVVPVSCRMSPLLDAAGTAFGVCVVVRENGREMDLRRQLEQTRHMAEARFAQSVVAQATLTPEGRIIEANEALSRLGGHAVQDLLGRPVSDFMVEQDAVEATRNLEKIASGEAPLLQRPRLLRHADGHLVETRVSVYPLRDASGAILRLEAMIEDVSETAAAQREVQLREARWRSLASHSKDVALFCDAAGKLLFATDATWTVLGYRAADFVNGDGWDLVHPDDVGDVRATWGAAVAAPRGSSVKLEFRMRHADGTWLWVEGTMTTELDDPAVAAMVVNIVDISDRKAAEATLEELAGLDTLTGLASRAPLMASLDAAFAAGLADTTAVAVVDITRLKLINDTYGHRTGDEVLVEVAQRLVRAVEGQGVVARIGGDHFAVLLTDVDDIGEVFETCAALLDAVEDPLQLDEQQLLLTAAIGAAVGPAVDSGALLASAESALGTAKEGLAGPLHVVRAESASAAVCRARLIEDLRRGIEDDELVVHFQPVIALSDGRPVAAEALVRWLHPEKGLLSPGAFIDAAEDSGLIIGVGEVVLNAACRAAARWAERGMTDADFHVAVNLSAKQLTRGGIVEVVRQALSSSGVAAHNLMLEVTESAVMSDVDAAVATLQELRALGIEIAVDDFGTGYSSLTYLKQFPVTMLKIDRSFVSGLGKNRDDAAIVTSVINLAKAMNLGCIAEGVESEQQRLVLQALGCRLGQGFLWSPGLDVAAMDAWLVEADARSARRDGLMHRGGAGSEAPTNNRLRGLETMRADPRMLARVRELTTSGSSLTTIAAALNADQQLTVAGKRWSARSVAELVAANLLHDAPGAGAQQDTDPAEQSRQEQLTRSKADRP